MSSRRPYPLTSDRRQRRQSAARPVPCQSPERSPRPVLRRSGERLPARYKNYLRVKLSEPLHPTCRRSPCTRFRTGPLFAGNQDAYAGRAYSRRVPSAGLYKVLAWSNRLAESFGISQLTCEPAQSRFFDGDCGSAGDARNSLSTSMADMKIWLI